MDTGGLMIIFGMISELDHAFCSPYIFCTRSQRVAALVSQIQITVRRASLSNIAGQSAIFFCLRLIFIAGWSHPCHVCPLSLFLYLFLRVFVIVIDLHGRLKPCVMCVHCLCIFCVSLSLSLIYTADWSDVSFVSTVCRFLPWLGQLPVEPSLTILTPWTRPLSPQSFRRPADVHRASLTKLKTYKLLLRLANFYCAIASD